ncbi:MAG: hypothetical protein ACTSSI_14755 [Candidatus Helarchaeota archaeon]
MNKNQTKTLICVLTAGLFFIPSVIFDLWFLIPIGAIFDWLPLPMGWMKGEEKTERKKNLIIIHAIITVIAYIFAIIWIFTLIWIYKFLFLEIWWAAVIIGVFLIGK